MKRKHKTTEGDGRDERENENSRDKVREGSEGKRRYNGVRR